MFNPNPAFLLVQKLKLAPRALHWESSLKNNNNNNTNNNNKINLPPVLIKAELYGLVLAPRLEKGYHQIWEANVQPLGPMFKHLLVTWGQFATQKCSKLAPK